MGVPQKMISSTELVVDEVNFSTMDNIEIRAKQDFFVFNPGCTVVETDPHKLIMGITAEDAAKLSKNKPLQIQILFTDHGLPRYSDIKLVKVDEVIGGIYGN